MKKVLTYLLYGLPVIFFVACYFLMTVWGEDIIQGAGTTPDIWNDLVGAFQHNSRLSDMYAWTVINFFDFQYSFGVDTIFRLIDVLLASGIIYLLTSLVLGRRPQLKLQDALIFALGFLGLILTPHGFTLYRGFSVIHNYLIIGISTLVFTLPFLRQVAGETVPKLYQKWPAAILIGLVFGMSSNITPIAFLLAFILVQLWRSRKEKSWKKPWRLPAWQYQMLGAMLVTVAVAYIFGAGVSTYANNPVYTETYDYLAFGDILGSLGSSVIRIIKHVIVNFGVVFGPVLLAAAIFGIIALIISRLRGQEFSLIPSERSVRRAVAVAVLFAAIYLLCGSQIILPVRLGLPAYLALLVALGIICKHWFFDQKILSVAGLKLVGAGFTILMLGLVGVKATFALAYRAEMAEIFEMIDNSDGSVVCLSREIPKPKSLPLVNLGQDETFAEWALPYLEVKGKKIVYCQ